MGQNAITAGERQRPNEANPFFSDIELEKIRRPTTDTEFPDRWFAQPPDYLSSVVVLNTSYYSKLATAHSICEKLKEKYWLPETDLEAKVLTKKKNIKKVYDEWTSDDSEEGQATRKQLTKQLKRQTIGKINTWRWTSQIHKRSKVIGDAAKNNCEWVLKPDAKTKAEMDRRAKQEEDINLCKEAAIEFANKMATVVRSETWHRHYYAVLQCGGDHKCNAEEAYKDCDAKWKKAEKKKQDQPLEEVLKAYDEQEAQIDQVKHEEQLVNQYDQNVKAKEQEAGIENVDGQELDDAVQKFEQTVEAASLASAQMSIATSPDGHMRKFEPDLDEYAEATASPAFAKVSSRDGQIHKLAIDVDEVVTKRGEDEKRDTQKVPDKRQQRLDQHQDMLTQAIQEATSLLHKPQMSRRELARYNALRHAIRIDVLGFEEVVETQDEDSSFVMLHDVLLKIGRPSYICGECLYNDDSLWCDAPYLGLCVLWNCAFFVLAIAMYVPCTFYILGFGPILEILLGIVFSCFCFVLATLTWLAKNFVVLLKKISNLGTWFLNKTWRSWRKKDPKLGYDDAIFDDGKRFKNFVSPFKVCLEDRPFPTCVKLVGIDD